MYVQSTGLALKHTCWRGRCWGSRAAGTVQPETRRAQSGVAAAGHGEAGVERGASLGSSGIDGECRELIWPGERLISRRPIWPAAPDHELGKGQPSRGRGWPVHAEGAPKGALVRSMRAARSMRAQQAPGTGPWPQGWGMRAPLQQGTTC